MFRSLFTRFLSSHANKSLNARTAPNICVRIPVRSLHHQFYRTERFENLNTKKLLRRVIFGSAALSLSYFAWRKIQKYTAPQVFAATVCDEEGSEPTTGTNYAAKFNFIADVVEKAAPSVVNIDIPARYGYITGQKMMGNGSGFIIQADGLILTNAHVVAGQQKVVVRLKDGKEFNGVVQAVDPVADLATVKIDATSLPVLKMGDSSSLRPGEFVIALGSPLALSNTVTSGIISSTSRGSEELGLDKDISYIQTDAPITHGNSGGPLVNLNGEAVGINTMKVTAGISFAIPSDYAKAFLKRAKEQQSRVPWKSGPRYVGSPRYRYIGVSMLSITPSLAADLQGRVEGITPRTRGILVYRVVVDSPAYRAGIQPGDVITTINGKSVSSSSELFGLVRSEDRLDCSVIRGGKPLNVSVVPEDVH